jgi:hypothetical protein
MATINHRDTVLLVIALLAARAINAMVRLRQSYGLSDSTQAAPFPEDGPLGRLKVVKGNRHRALRETASPEIGLHRELSVG